MDLKVLLSGLELDSAVDSLTSHYGISKEQLSSISIGLFPLITKALRDSLSNPSLMETLVQVGSKIDIEGIKSTPTSVLTAENKELGQNVLTSLLGGNESVSKIISSLSASVGVDKDKLLEFIPSLTTLSVGALMRNSGGLSSLVTSMLTSGLTDNAADSPLENILGAANKILDGQGLDGLMRGKN